MEIVQEVKIKQEQRLILTPAMLQSIELLRCSGSEFEEYLKVKLLENPMLEREELNNDKPHKEDGYCFGASVFLEDVPHEIAAEEDGLKKHLRFQLAGYKDESGNGLSDRDERLALYLIESMDENGYFTSTLREVSDLTGIPLGEVKNVARVIRSFEPVGVGALNLADCLSMQLRALGKGGELADVIVRNHLKEIARGGTGRLCEKLQVTDDELTEALEVIRGLDPKPGARYATDMGDNGYIVPDAYIEEEKNGDSAETASYSIFMRYDRTAGVTVSSEYKEVMGRASRNQEVKEYLREKIKEADWLIRNITSRQETMYKVFCLIVQRQQEFMEKGIRYLKPMTQQDVAQVLDINVSTVSRAVNGKYLQTPQGIYEAKFFFSGGLGREEEISSVAVKVILKELVAAEDKAKPYSDSRLAELLAERDIKIARRTVAKYREQLGIPAAQSRKR